MECQFGDRILVPLKRSRILELELVDRGDVAVDQLVDAPECHQDLVFNDCEIDGLRNLVEWILDCLELF